MIERDEKGRFTQGGKPGPGRPKRVVEVSFHSILVEAVSEDLWRGIVKVAIRDALKGDKYAREWISNYTLGRPPQILELRAADATLLKELLQRFEAQNIPASAVFNAMLATFADVEQGSEVDDER